MTRTPQSLRMFFRQRVPALEEYINSELWINDYLFAGDLALFYIDLFQYVHGGQVPDQVYHSESSPFVNKPYGSFIQLYQSLSKVLDELAQTDKYRDIIITTFFEPACDYLIRNPSRYDTFWQPFSIQTHQLFRETQDV